MSYAPRRFHSSTAMTSDRRHPATTAAHARGGHAPHSRVAAALIVAVLWLGAAPGIAAALSVNPVATLTSAQRQFLVLAGSGLSQAHRWAAGQWYCEYLGCRTAYPLLTIWGGAQMFEALDAVALTDPTHANLAHLARVARFAERYWNPKMGGYSPYPNDRLANAQLWFDDNGWLGLSFLNAYRASGEVRYLRDAQRAYRFIVARGWDNRNGGMWWNTSHPYHSGEALAADSLLGVLLYGVDREGTQLASATKFIDWANQHDTGYHDLYMSGGPGSAVIDYVQAPLIYAQQTLCTQTGKRTYCEIAAEKARLLVHLWGTQYNLAPQYDSIFLQWMMAYGEAVGDPHWLAVASANAAAATTNASDGQGLWLRGWWGPIHDPQTRPGMLRTVGGTTSLFAWLAYYSR